MTLQQSASRRRWRIALVASVGLNLLLVAVIGVWAIRPMFRGPSPQPEFGRVVERMAHRVNSDDAAMLRRSYQSHRDDIARLAGNVRESRERVRAIMRTEPFDPDKLAAAMADLRAARSAMEGAIQAVMQEAAASMSSDGRHTLARGPRVDER